jgi:hypothetical protein
MLVILHATHAILPALRSIPGAHGSIVRFVTRATRYRKSQGNKRQNKQKVDNAKLHFRIRYRDEPG